MHLLISHALIIIILSVCYHYDVIKVANLRPIYEKRSKIINGSYEPTEIETIRTEEEKEDDPLLPDPPSDVEDVKGIPEFWLTCLKNSPPFQEIITEKDEGDSFSF